MKVLLKQLCTVVCSCFILTSCATTEGDSGRAGDIDYRGSDCISIRTIRDYTPLDDRSFLVEVSAKRIYYVQLHMTTFGLRSAYRLGFESRDEWLCPYGGDEVVFDGMMNERAGIRAISRITAEQADELLIRHGRKEPDEQQDPPPAELEGAEVEELGQTG